MVFEDPAPKEIPAGRGRADTSSEKITKLSIRLSTRRVRDPLSKVQNRSTATCPVSQPDIAILGAVRGFDVSRAKARLGPSLAGGNGLEYDCRRHADARGNEK